jgi:hypothetical protein
MQYELMLLGSIGLDPVAVSEPFLGQHEILIPVLCIAVILVVDHLIEIAYSTVFVWPMPFCQHCL